MWRAAIAEADPTGAQICQLMMTLVLALMSAVKFRWVLDPVAGALTEGQIKAGSTDYVKLLHTIANWSGVSIFGIAFITQLLSIFGIAVGINLMV